MNRLLVMIAMIFNASPVIAQNASTKATISGQIIWPKNAELPKQKLIAGAPAAMGPILDDELQMNRTNRGLKNVWVYLRPDSNDRKATFKPEQIDVKPQAKSHLVQFPHGLFIPKILAIRSGDSITFQNNSPRAHNIKVDADDPKFFARALPPFAAIVTEGPFDAQRVPALFSCSINPWMTGAFMIFDHSYFALTDDDGKFEIKDIPVGKYRVVYRHRNGYHKGKDGSLGWEVDIKDDGKGTIQMKPVEFEMPGEK